MLVSELSNVEIGTIIWHEYFDFDDESEHIIFLGCKLHEFDDEEGDDCEWDEDEEDDDLDLPDVYEVRYIPLEETEDGFVITHNTVKTMYITDEDSGFIL